MDQIKLQEIIGLVKSERFKSALKRIDHEIKSGKKSQLLYQIKAEVLRKTGNDLESAECYKISAEMPGSNTAHSWYNAGVQYQKISKISDSIQAYKKAIQVDPNHLGAKNNLCVLLYNSNQTEAALPYAKWIRNHSEKPDHLINAGYVLRGNNFHDEAEETFQRALQATPDDMKVISAALQSAQYVCNWDTLVKLESRLLNEIYNSGNFKDSRELHHVHVAWCDNESINHDMAVASTQRLLGDVNPSFDHANHLYNDKIRVGYVSADFFNHATLHLIIGVFEHHNKDKFEIFAYCHSRNDNSAYRKRFEASVDYVKDIGNLTDDEAAQLIYDDKIDILVDLKGFTDKNRLRIFAKRPAPIQVTYIGFPGTSGAKFFDYAITDRVVTPDSSIPYYSEKLCRLPEAYQCNDNKRIIASNELNRSDYALPDGAFVFCCFNQSYKIDRVFFNAWMEILNRSSNSVLWILDPGEAGAQRLRKAAVEKGISPNRIIFAEKEPPPIHLKRIASFANLALDTRIVNGHTTTSDALWAGVPVLTMCGKHFNSRVSTTLLKAADLEELVAYTVVDYIEKAVLLSTNVEAYNALRLKVENNRFVTPIFDTDRFTHHFEMGLELIVQAKKSGKIETIDVPCLPKNAHPFMHAVPTAHINYKIANNKELLEITSDHFTSTKNCTLCNSDDTRPVRASKILVKHAEKEVEVEANWLICNNCKHLFRSRMLDRSSLGILVNQPQALSLSRIDSFEILSTSHALLGKSLLAKDIKILDVYPSTRMFFGTGVEFGYTMSAITRQEMLAPLKKFSQSVISADFLKANVNGKPNIINLERSLESAPFPKDLIRKADSILEKNGLITVVFSNHSSMEWVELNENAQCAYWNDAVSNNLFKRESIIRLFEEYGYSQVACKAIDKNEAGVVIVFKKARQK